MTVATMTDRTEVPTTTNAALAELEPLFLPEEAAALLRLPDRTMRRLMKTGQVPVVMVGGRRRIRRSVLEELLQRGTVKA